MVKEFYFLRLSKFDPWSYNNLFFLNVSDFLIIRGVRTDLRVHEMSYVLNNRLMCKLIQRYTRWIKKKKKDHTLTIWISVSQFSSIRLPNLTLRCHSRISSSRLARRELSSLFPLHRAIASACLESKTPTEVTTSSEGHSFSPLSSLSFIFMKWNA
jgi:hypothetical protein